MMDLYERIIVRKGLKVSEIWGSNGAVIPSHIEFKITVKFTFMEWLRSYK